MKLRSVMIFSLFFFCLFALTLCQSEKSTKFQKESPGIETRTGEVKEMTGRESLKAKMVFCEEAEQYIKEEMDKGKWEINPKEKLADRLIEIKGQLMTEWTHEAEETEPGETLKQLNAQIESDSPAIKFISGKDIPGLFKKYSGRDFEFEVKHVFVSRIPETEVRYFKEEKPENRIDMVAYVVFKYRLIEKEAGKNLSGTGCFASPHREICEW